MNEHTDATFYRSPSAAIAAPPEELAYVAGVRSGRRAPRRDDRDRLQCGVQLSLNTPVLPAR